MDDRVIPRGVATLSGSVRVYFDGACELARGVRIAAYGFHLEGGGFLHEDYGLAVAPGSPNSTNNVAEYVAAIRALEWLVGQHYSREVALYGDSELVIRQMNGEYEVRAEHLKAYHDHLAQLAARFPRAEFHWIPREENQRADILSKLAIEKEIRGHRPARTGAGGGSEDDDRTPPGEPGA